jgi:hypothetical protein
MQDKTQMDVYTHELDLKKAEAVHGHDRQKSEMDFGHKVSTILADLYKHDTKLEHEKGMNAKKAE